MFQFPFGSHATDGNEALSLCLYSYRQLWEQRAAVTDGANAVSNEESSVPVILCVNNVRSNVQFESSALSNISQCAARLGMTVDCCESAAQVDSVCSRRRVAVVIARLHDPGLAEIAEAAHRASTSLHIHVLAHEWCEFFARHSSPVHIEVPKGVRSISIEEGLFCSGFSVYRDAALRDMHLDVGYGWQAAYMSPNEGGSGASTPLFLDFCITMLGWSAIADMANGGGGGAMMARNGDLADRSLCPTLIPPFCSESYGQDHKEWKAGSSDETFADMVSKTPPQVLNWRKPASKFQIIEWGLSCISGDRDPRAVTSELTSWDNDDTSSSSPTSS